MDNRVGDDAALPLDPAGDVLDRRRQTIAEEGAVTHDRAVGHGAVLHVDAAAATALCLGEVVAAVRDHQTVFHASGAQVNAAAARATIPLVAVVRDDAGDQLSARDMDTPGNRGRIAIAIARDEAAANHAARLDTHPPAISPLQGYAGGGDKVNRLSRAVRCTICRWRG